NDDRRRARLEVGDELRAIALEHRRALRTRARDRHRRGGDERAFVAKLLRVLGCVDALLPDVPGVCSGCEGQEEAHRDPRDQATQATILRRSVGDPLQLRKFIVERPRWSCLRPCSRDRRARSLRARPGSSSLAPRAAPVLDEMLTADFNDRLSVEHGAPCEQEVRDRSERMDLGAGVGRVRLEDRLRSHVLRRAGQQPGRQGCGTRGSPSSSSRDRRVPRSRASHRSSPHGSFVAGSHMRWSSDGRVSSNDTNSLTPRCGSGRMRTSRPVVFPHARREDDDRLT
ncbi:MAG: hypothetical protein JWO86_30, partial [Myxococcaceae bacterium]|nr:hypothetical protein [Myxococcaceae bacterium]